MSITDLTTADREHIEGFEPGLKMAKFADLVQSLIDHANAGARQVRIAATNATALGLTDVATVVSIVAFVTSTGAPATKALLDVTTDYTVASGDVTPVGDHSTETWLITYKPL